MHLLNDDILRLVIDNLCPRSNESTLSALSQTSRRIRTLCLPVLYSTVELDLDFDLRRRHLKPRNSGWLSVPDSVRPYVRYGASEELIPRSVLTRRFRHN